MYLGMRPAESPYVISSKFFTSLYFLYFSSYLPVISILSATMIPLVPGGLRPPERPAPAGKLLQILCFPPRRKNLSKRTAYYILFYRSIGFSIYLIFIDPILDELFFPS